MSRNSFLSSARVGLLAALILVTAAVQTTSQSYRFTSFVFEGNQRIEEATILDYLGVVPGQTISAAEVNDGLNRLQASGLFEEVTIVPSGSTLMIVVKEYPTINQINFEGNRRLNDEALGQLILSQPRRVFSPATAEADTRAIAAAYEVSGRLAATVTPRIIRRSDNRVDLIFEIAEGRVTEIERVSFVGNRAYSDRRLRRVLETKQAGLFRSVIRSDTFIADRIAFDEQLLRDFYLARGYVDAQVLSVTPELTPTRDAFLLTFRIREGQQYRLGRIEAFSDLPEIDLDLYQSEIKAETGDIYSPRLVDNAVERLELLATSQGLNFIRVRPNIIRNDAELTLDLEYIIERGPRVFVERIDIEGNATTLDRVIRNRFRTVEGDPFNPREIRAAAERLRALNYFSNVEVSARPGSSESQSVVDVNVEEQPTGTLGFSVSYEEQDGAGLAVTLSESNFLGRGQSVGLSFDTTSDAQNANISFSEPYFLGRDLTFSIGAGYTTTDSQDATYDTTTALFRTGLSYPLGEFSRIGLRYRLSNDELGINDPDATSEILINEADSAVTSAIEYSWSYDTRGRGLDPTRGIALRFAQEYAGLGGDVEHIKTTFAVIGEQDVFNEEVTLIAALEGGHIIGLGDSGTRINTRFFNNQRQLRGFEAGGIGPRDTNASDDPLGGNSYVAVRLEAQFPLIFLPEEYGMRGAVFADAGSVWDLDDTNGGTSGNDPVDDGFNLRSVVGFGLLWDTQIGPLRFNFTRALSSEPYDREQSFDFTIQTRF